jgi:transcriptional regulator of acetoin/glycerol metabolism
MIHFTPAPIAEEDTCCAAPVNNTRDNLKGVADLIQRVADCERFRFTNHTCAEADNANATSTISPGPNIST